MDDQTRKNDSNAPDERPSDSVPALFAGGASSETRPAEAEKRTVTGDAQSANSATDGVWLAEGDFHSPRPPAHVGRLPGPGLPEAIAWVFGVLLLQIFAGVVVTILVIAYYAATLPAAERSGMLESLHDPNVIAEIESRFLTPVIAITQSIFLVGAIVAAGLRFGRRTPDLLPLIAVPVRHAVLLVVLLLPMMVISKRVYTAADAVWQWIVEQTPALGGLDAMNSMDLIGEIIGTTSPWLLLFMLAVVPAVAEELVFRGVIGRGLTARWGLIWGVLLASWLFAVMHIYPAHVIGVLPLGIAMHLVYLATRSFWAPVAYHFLNNAGAVLAASFYPNDVDKADAKPEIALAVDESASLLLVAMAIACAVSVLTLMWQMRVRYLLPSGETWDPGYLTVERPPASLNAVRSCGKVNCGLALVTGMAILAFLLRLGYELAP